MFKFFLGLVIIWIGFGWSSLAQSNDSVVRGVVYGIDENAKERLIGASIRWKGTTIGVVTDEKGEFKLSKNKTSSVLEVTYVGYEKQEIEIESNDLVVLLRSENTLEGLEVVGQQNGILIDRINPIKSELISESELLKAACCNLSESFETNPSVDVSFTDAVTGTRQIQMLGLSGPYIQISRENMPDIRGLSSVYGLIYIPGTWIESLQLSKGTGSVVNGFESMAGQINVELRKPERSDKLYVNLYGNQGGRVEANVNVALPVNEHWSTAVLLHNKYSVVKNDRNNDGFLDMPLGAHYIGLNRWKYVNESGLVGQFGIKGTYIEKTGGQLDFDPDVHLGGTSFWGVTDDTRRVEGWGKVGKVYPQMPWRSFGIQINAVYHDQESYFGIRNYQGTQTSLYGNVIYHSIIGNTNHPIKMGASVQYDYFDEQLSGIGSDMEFTRREFVPGVFMEYKNSPTEKWTIIPGLRVDYHNNFGLFVTPRLHAMYQISKLTALRFTAGRGQRTASIIAENIGALASSRVFNVVQESAGNPYGLEAEVSWNIGVSLTQDFTIGDNLGTISTEYYRTQFQNQIVVDFDSDPQQITFYNLDGESYSNSAQIQLDYELFTNFSSRLGYRWFDVETTYSGSHLTKPLVSNHRWFMNLGYKTFNDWSFDYTLNWMGSKRLPSTRSNPLDYQIRDFSDDFMTMNVQVSKGWSSTFELYVGAENLMDVRQESPILASDNPFSEYFDSSLVWGPVFGRIIYTGIRYKLL
ncbi:TonB-dependent receptor [Reichenbachiella versicolor]|uniref:TonB-dependent receptor n=1 Tax=Reichenbachiella versicolor TaxID=1821036 RepID=UPI000D6E1031|nr:TonB-dependent receptor [Reichenbachiella versicolor]